MAVIPQTSSASLHKYLVFKKTDENIFQSLTDLKITD